MARLACLSLVTAAETSVARAKNSNSRKCARGLSTGSARRCEPKAQEEQAGKGESEGDSPEDVKINVLYAALDYVPQHGWSRAAIVKGAAASGLPGVAHGMFPRGGVELVSFFYRACNEQLAEQLAEKRKAAEEEGAVKIKVGRFVRDAVIERLTMIHPYMDQWPQAMALQALPRNAPHAWGNLAALVDDIWHYAGDTSADMNWYTKRLSLAAVYKSSEIFMLQDRSETFADTWTFVDRRLADVASAGKAFQNVKQSGDTLCKGLHAASILGRNMLGINSRQRYSGSTYAHNDV